MALYTFYLINGDGSVPAFEFDECSNDSVARDRAREVLSSRPERSGVEVWRGDRLVGQSAAQASSRP